MPAPEDFPLTEKMIDWASRTRTPAASPGQGRTVAEVIGDLDYHRQAFLDRCESRGYRYADYVRAWMDWAKRDATEGKPAYGAAGGTNGYGRQPINVHHDVPRGTFDDPDLDRVLAEMDGKR